MANYLRLDTGWLIKSGDELHEVVSTGVPYSQIDGSAAVEALKEEMIRLAAGGKRNARRRRRRSK